MADLDRRVIVDGVDFGQLFHFPRIFTAVFAALQPPRLMIGLFIVLVLGSIGRLWDAASSGAPFATAVTLADYGFLTITQGLFALSPQTLYQGIAILLIQLPVTLWESHKIFCIVYGLIFVIVMAVGGGAIARMAAVQMASHMRVPAFNAVQFAFTRWLRFAIAPLMPLVAAAVVALVIVIMGLLILIPGLNILGGILYIIALLLGLLIAFLLLVYALAFIMVVPAMAVEDCDGADGQQRAYGYVLSKPLHMLGYLLIGLIGLTLGYFIVSLFAGAVLSITSTLYGAFDADNPALTPTRFVPTFLTNETPAEETVARWDHRAAGWFINLWQSLVVSLVWAYVVSYFFSAATIIYLLMRRVSDGQDIQEIWETTELQPE